MPDRAPLWFRCEVVPSDSRIESFIPNAAMFRRETLRNDLFLRELTSS
jgi:hypothetical protein